MGQCSQAISLPGEDEEKARQQQSRINRQDEGRKGEVMVGVSVESLSRVHSKIQHEEESTESRTNFSDNLDDLGEEEEDEDEEEEEVSSRTEPRSILPTSVLDKASVIAEHFASSLSRQSSLTADDMFSLGCPSSQSGSRRSSVFSLNVELFDKEKTQELNCSSPEPVTVKLVPESLASVTLGDRLVTPDQRPQTKPDTLSKKDRMLIHKVKQYYEHAEQQDANFSIKRRESLSYIPAGLVRNLSQQLNGVPPDEAVASHKKITRPTSWAVFDLPGLGKDKNSEKAMDTEILPIMERKEAMDRSQAVAQALDTEEDFRSPSVMTRVWQDMEVEISGANASKMPQNAFKDDLNGTVANLTQDQKGQASYHSVLGEPPLILEEFGNSMAEHGTSTPPPLNNFLGKNHETGSGLYSDPRLPETRRMRPAPLTKIICLGSDSEEDLMQEDMEKMKNKVFHLARQYSQRIKNNRPVVKQKAKVSECSFSHKTLSSVVEDKMPENEMGKYFKSV